MAKRKQSHPPKKSNAIRPNRNLHQKKPDNFIESPNQTAHDNRNITLTRKWRLNKWVSSVLVVFCAILLISLYFILQKPAPVSISGSIDSMGNAVTSFDSFMFNQFSPACGCMKDGSEWRGIGVFSRYLSLATDSNNQNIFIVSPAPSSINNFPGLAFDITIYKFQARPNEHSGFSTDFDRNELFNKNFTHPSITFKLSLTKRIFLHIQGTGQIGIFQKGIAPLALWNPGKSSQVLIENSSKDLKLGEWFETNRSTPHLWSEKENEINLNKEFPILDLIGSPILIWGWDNINVSVNDESVWRMFKNVTSNNNQGNNPTKEYIAIVVDAPFAVRLINLPPYSGNKEITDNYLDTLTKNIGEKATFTLFAFEDENVKNDLESAKKAIAESPLKIVNNVVSAPNIFNDFPPLFPKIEKDYFPFQYPILPEYWGFSIYSKVPDIVLGDAKGALMLNSKNLQIGARSDISLRGVNNLSLDAGSLSLMPNGLTEFKAKVDIVKVNNEVVYTYFDKYSRALTILTIILAFLGITPIVLSSIRYLRKSK